jgi:predicted nicotinamide N-methyase
LAIPVASTSFDAFVRAHTHVSAPILCPEIFLHLSHDLDSIWESQEVWLGRCGLAPPFWAVAWVGGQALARYTLDNPSLFRGLSILDVGSGSGLCAIAAAKAGAEAVEAYDIDPFSRDVADINARLNEVRIESLLEDVVGIPSRWDVVLAGDLWYEQFLSERLTAWLRRIAGTGTMVLLGDCGRAHFPRFGVTELKQYEVPSPTSLERNAVTTTGVWRIH